jgi:hypothetical protein
MPRQTLDTLHAQGFDASTHTFGRPNLLSVACSQCAAAVINSVPCHEAGCPNTVYECKGCNATVARRGAYCDDCR